MIAASTNSQPPEVLEPPPQSSGFPEKRKLKWRGEVSIFLCLLFRRSQCNYFIFIFIQASPPPPHYHVTPHMWAWPALGGNRLGLSSSPFVIAFSLPGKRNYLNNAPSTPTWRPNPRTPNPRAHMSAPTGPHPVFQCPLRVNSFSFVAGSVLLFTLSHVPAARRT